MIKGIINRAVWKNGNPINVLTFPTHSPVETTLANQLKECTFYAYRDEGIIPEWNNIRQKPDNYVLLEHKAGDQSIPRHVDFHLILCQNVAAQYKYADRYSQLLGIPIINYIHTMPPLGFNKEYLNQYKRLNVAKHIFITEYSREIWGFNEEDSEVIYHGIEEDIYKPLPINRQPYIMSLGNLYEERWRELGFDLYTKIAPGLPVRHFGSSNGGKLPNNPINNTDDLVREFATCGLFLNTSRWSPIPRSLTEALMCGCPIVTSNGSAIPELLTHEYDCLMFPLDKPELGRKYCHKLLSDPSYAKELGDNARKTALKLFSVDRYKEQFRDVFRKAVKS